MKNKKEIPCVDCITLAICKSILIESKKRNVPHGYNRGIVHLGNKCSLLREFFTREKRLIIRRDVYTILGIPVDISIWYV